jgi:hypothetical protein
MYQKFKGYIWGIATAVAFAAGVAYGATQVIPYIVSGTLTPNAVVVGGSDGVSVAAGSSSYVSKYFDASWIAGVTVQNVKVPIGNLGGGTATATSATCRPEVLTGGTSTADIYYAASATACAAGTKINTSSCNGNTGAATTQSMGITNSAIPANSAICVVFSNDAAWTSTPGTGNIQLHFTQP